MKSALPAKIPNFVCNEKGRYCAKKPLTEAQIIKAAQALLTNQHRTGRALTSPDATRCWLTLSYRDLEHEVFICLFLDNQHHVITHEELFRGTIDGAAVYPREVAKRALQLNAAAVIFAHNHPSGTTEPSSADRSITEKLKAALNLLDIRTLDHFIIGKTGAYSFAEHGLI
ncbi:DNA repair protein RadC [Methylomicrobium sp. Wu6]|uniref:JAB domain-containing protein n=1 Tax=Methylomicrobium sp. Wu6 TaxID=3107928 RepID=UPI002DD6204C|nr:DNA repair protein RadC [Methylomicrobium sp. Wu6]MEC4747958.1 DNA repair protein RadC [Methylomicrobium sp. Wu6]